MALKTILLTGDSTTVAKTVGEGLGVDEIAAELLPEQKLFTHCQRLFGTVRHPQYPHHFEREWNSSYALAELRHLTDNIGPRLGGSRQAQQQAVEYLAAEMRALGAEVQLEKTIVPHLVRGIVSLGGGCTSAEAQPTLRLRTEWSEQLWSSSA